MACSNLSTRDLVFLEGVGLGKWHGTSKFGEHLAIEVPHPPIIIGKTSNACIESFSALPDLASCGPCSLTHVPRISSLFQPFGHSRDWACRKLQRIPIRSGSGQFFGYFVVIISFTSSFSPPCFILHSYEPLVQFLALQIQSLFVRILETKLALFENGAHAVHRRCDQHHFRNRHDRHRRYHHCTDCSPCKTV